MGRHAKTRLTWFHPFSVDWLTTFDCRALQLVSSTLYLGRMNELQEAETGGESVRGRREKDSFVR